MAKFEKQKILILFIDFSAVINVSLKESLKIKLNVWHHFELLLVVLHNGNLRFLKKTFQKHFLPKKFPNS